MNRNNNPLNVKWADPGDPSVKWKGSGGYDSRGHAIFEDPAMGIRAAMRSLQKKWHNGKRTIRRIYEDWAPPSDTIGSLPGRKKNDPYACACFVARKAEWDADRPLPMPETPEGVEVYERVITAMARLELGAECEPVHITRGLGNWWDDFAGGK